MFMDMDNDMPEEMKMAMPMEGQHQPGPMRGSQMMGQVGNAVPLKAQVSGELGQHGENEGTAFDLYSGPEGEAGAITSVVGKQSRHTIG